MRHFLFLSLCKHFISKTKMSQYSINIINLIKKNAVEERQGAQAERKWKQKPRGSVNVPVNLQDRR